MTSRAVTRVQSFRQFLWHPFQGLWNRRLVEAVGGTFSGIPRKVIIKFVILLDTAILAIRALARRVSRLGLASVTRTPRVPDGVPVVYLDLGTHKEARELSFMVHSVLPSFSRNFTAYGFEAILEFFEHARASSPIERTCS